MDETTKRKGNPNRVKGMKSPNKKIAEVDVGEVETTMETEEQPVEIEEVVEHITPDELKETKYMNAGAFNPAEMIDGMKICNMLRIMMLAATKRVYFTRAAFKEEVEFEVGHSVTFYPGLRKCIVIFNKTETVISEDEHYPIEVLMPLLERYFFTLENTDVF